MRNFRAGGGGETTAYVYGVTTAGGSGIDSNDTVGATQWPDPTTGVASSSEQETTTVNALGETRTSTDRNGTAHTLTYDVLGRVVSDAVTTLGAGVDGSVRRIDTAYDSQGNAYLITSYDAVTGGTIVNQVENVYNGLGQRIAQYQAVGGAVNLSTTPKVQYTYSEMAGGANHSRLTSVVYPDGYTVHYNYASGLDDRIGRLTSLSDSAGTLESYLYLGLGTVVERGHPESTLVQTFISQNGSTGDAGDQYTGLDRFGRVVEQLWYTLAPGVPSTAVTVFDVQYGYDANGNVLWRNDRVNSSFSELYTYDTLNQLATFARGTLNGTKTGISGTPGRTQSWDYDALGNWNGVTTDGSTETRSSNAQNEYTSIGGATTPAYDASGNMTTDETGRQFVYDAWNRLVAVKNASGTTLETFSYDSLNRRVTNTVGGTTTDLYYSDGWQVLEERVGTTYTTRYVWSPVYVDAMVSRDRDTDANGTLDERLWAVQDANWNVTGLVDGTGAVVERYAYDPFGVRTVYSPDYSMVRTGGSDYGFDQGFQGMFFDSTSELYRSRFRGGYSPTLGRWIQTDPIGFAGGDMNLYGFVGNGPVNSTDPSGLVVTTGYITFADYFGEYYANLYAKYSAAGKGSSHPIIDAVSDLANVTKFKVITAIYQIIKGLNRKIEISADTSTDCDGCCHFTGKPVVSIPGILGKGNSFTLKLPKIGNFAAGSGITVEFTVTSDTKKASCKGDNKHDTIEMKIDCAIEFDLAGLKVPLKLSSKARYTLTCGDDNKQLTPSFSHVVKSGPGDPGIANPLDANKLPDPTQFEFPG